MCLPYDDDDDDDWTRCRQDSLSNWTGELLLLEFGGKRAGFCSSTAIPERSKEEDDDRRRRV